MRWDAPLPLQHGDSRAFDAENKSGDAQHSRIKKTSCRPTCLPRTGILEGLRCLLTGEKENSRLKESERQPEEAATITYYTNK
jgi:hypothetical protein